MLIIEKKLGRDDEHNVTKDLVLNKLNQLGLDYRFVFDSDIQDIDFEDYKYIMTLGGDGTFLRTAKKVKNQYVIGVNSNLQRSVGFLTNFNKKNISGCLEKILSNNFEYDELSRLRAKVDGIVLPYLAVNEVLIGDTDIRKVSHLDIRVQNKSSFVRGGVFIVSTQQGSNAFYKSAGGTPFDVNAIGYVMVLPYSVDGDLSKMQVLDLTK